MTAKVGRKGVDKPRAIWTPTDGLTHLRCRGIWERLEGKVLQFGYGLSVPPISSAGNMAMLSGGGTLKAHGAG